MAQLKINGEADENTLKQMETCLNHDAVRGVLCADNHVGYAQPVGGVVAYDGKISISGVGYDIACGNMAVKLPLKFNEINDWKSIGRRIQKEISFGVGRTNDTKVEAEFLDNDDNWANPFTKDLRDLAAAQLGTVGSGNHYVDVLRDEDGFVWVGVHFGSRGYGHKITTRHLEAAGGKEGMFIEPTVVDLNSDLGRSYYESMQLAGEFAYAGREYVCRTVAKIIQGNDNFIDEVHNHHNYAWLEEHDGQELFVVRKGATPAFPGQRGFIGGSMGDICVIVRGLDTPEAKENLYSTVHGAGRILTRTKAAGKYKPRHGKNRKLVEPGIVDWDKARADVLQRGTIVLGAGADESPQCYRQLADVLQYHTDSIAVEHTLHPIVVVMAGSDEYDPYKD